ncbi:MAG TPA: hypothetical protein VNI77_11420 [Nitrososphaera sp.]|nr:hypothetical protein [Nitrososphaera sp.]
MVPIDKDLSAVEEIPTELQYFRYRKHRDDTFARMIQDKSLEPIGNEFSSLTTKGSSVFKDGFSHLEYGSEGLLKN